MADPEPLDPELARLRERAAALSEDDPKPRGALPALFRAIRAAEGPARAGALGELAASLADTSLLEPTFELVRELGGEDAFVAALPGRGRYCVQDQARALQEAGPAPSWVLSALELLVAEEERDPTELALALGPERTTQVLDELLRIRLRAPARRRDRTSGLLARGALRALSSLAPDLSGVQRAIGKILAAETRRAGKGEPVLALAALDALERFPAVERLRLLERWSGQIERRKVLTRIAELRQASEAELGLDPLELSELLARAGGLIAPDEEAAGDEDAVEGGQTPVGAHVPVDLDEGGRIGITLDARGECARVELEPNEDGAELSRADERALSSAEAELQSARAALVERLEQAMLSGRDWSLASWRLIFAGEAGGAPPHLLWADLIPRVIWERRRDGERAWFRWEAGETKDVFGDPLPLEPEDRVGLAHPTLGDPEELELWREWALNERACCEPFLQLFRPVLSRPDAEGYDPSSLRGREVFREAVTEWARREGVQGAPLAGAGPWDLWREQRGHELRLTLEPLEVAFKATLAQRKAAHRKAREGEKVVIRGHKDEAPRATLGAVEIVALGDADAGDAAVVRAEAIRALEALSEGLLLPDELWLRAWQADKWKDPAASWKEVVLRYRLGSPATLALRTLYLRHFAAQAGLDLRIEDRFAITAATVIELGTGRCHAGPPKDYLPQWKVDERTAEVELPARSWPTAAGLDQDSRKLVDQVLGLILADSRAEGSAESEE